jgi:hypothetical protein
MKIAAGGPSVAVPLELKESLHLHPDSAPTSDNSSDYHYMVAGYHQLHCLVRFFLARLSNPRNLTRPARSESSEMPYTI